MTFLQFSFWLLLIYYLNIIDGNLDINNLIEGTTAAHPRELEHCGSELKVIFIEHLLNIICFVLWMLSVDVII